MSEKVTVKVERSVLHLPAIALRGLVVFPNNLLHFEVGREKSIAAVEWAVSNNSDVFLVAQKEMKVEDPKAADLYTYGVVAEVKQVMRVSDDLVRILVEGKYRAKLSEMEDDGTLEAFVRIGNESVRASATELKRLVLRGRNASYDSQVTLYRVEDYAFSKLRERHEKWTGNSFDNQDLGQHRTIPAIRLKHRPGGCGTASALPKCSPIHKVLPALLA